jgi:hypothetical protein
LNVFVEDAAFPIRRDAGTMDDFRATTLRVADERARMATWMQKDSAQPYQLGVSFYRIGLTLVFSSTSEDALTPTKSAIHAIQWKAPHPD